MNFNMRAARIATEKVFGKIGKYALWVGAVGVYFILTEVAMFMVLAKLFSEETKHIFAFVLWALSMGNVITILVWLANYSDALMVVEAEAQKAPLVKRREEI